MRRALILAGALSLAGCGAGYEHARVCRRDAGPEPYAWGKAFGLVGALVMVSTPEYQAWARDVDGCMARYRDAGR
jgi:hypothetical protein